MSVVLPFIDRRGLARKLLNSPAWIDRGRSSALECSVIDMTFMGARVNAPDTALPDEFVLYLDAKAALKRRCKVIWRDGFQVGVQFLDR